MKYKTFPKFIYRLPALPINYTSKKAFWTPFLSEAIYLASPDLHLSISKNTASGIDKLPEKLKFSLNKYLSRMMSRCTPFGLFAGIGIGRIDENSEIVLPTDNIFNSVTRLDMNFLCALIQSIENIPEVRNELIYYPNSSAYTIHDRLRYVEFNYRASNRKHYLSEIEKDNLLEEILVKSSSGIKLNEIISLISLHGHNYTDASEYAISLIENQILISELDPGVTGEDLLKTLIYKLTQRVPENNLITQLQSISDKLNYIDSLPIGRPLSYYKNLEEEIIKLNVGYDRKFLFQTDLKVTDKCRASLNHMLIKQVSEGITILNRLSPHNSSALTAFKEKFYARYEEEEVPLCEVLDADIGITFLNSAPGSGAIHPLIDDIQYRSSTSAAGGQTVNEIEIFLYNKFLESSHNKTLEVEISEEEIMKFRENWDNLPTTFSCLIEVLKIGENNDNLISIGPVGGSSAVNLLSRFCHLDEAIKEHALTITDFEKNTLSEGKLICEIVHLPESRTGNVLHRPILRDHEINYLSNHGVSSQNMIDISDIYISVKRRNQIVLRSKKLNKEIIPRLSTAHNFNFNTLPIYQFLCLIQTDGIRGGLTFNWGNLVGNKGFYPRVKFNNVILSLAKWHIDSKILSKLCNTPGAYHEFKSIKKQFRLPKFVNIVKGDNKIMLNLDEQNSIDVLVLESKKQTMIVIEEFLFDQSHSLIKSENNNYVNQLIISYYKEEK